MAVFLAEDAIADLTSMDIAEDIEEDRRRSVVIATCELFRRVRWARLSGNHDRDQPSRVVWHGLLRKTPEELGMSAVTVVICGTTMEFVEGVRRHPALWRTFPLACDDCDVAEAFVGLSFEELKVVVCVALPSTTAFRAYGATKQILARFGRVKLIIKAGHCAGPYNEGTVVVLDRGFYTMQAAEEVVLGKLGGNNYADRLDRVWHGLRRKTAEELGMSAVTAVVCGTTIKLLEGVRPALWRTFPLACDEDDVAEAFVGLSFEVALRWAEACHESRPLCRPLS